MVSSFTWWLWYCKATLSTFSVSQDGSRPNCDNCFFLFSSIFTFTFDVYTVNDDIHWIIKSQSASLLHLDLCLVSLKRPWNLFKVDGNGAVRKVTQIASERHCCSRTSPSCAECQRRTSRIHSKATAGKREADSIDIANEPWPWCCHVYAYILLRGHVQLLMTEARYSNISNKNSIGTSGNWHSTTTP